MFKNNFKITLRYLAKNKIYTAINIGGLSLGIVSALVIFLILRFENSFDTYHDDAERVYRVVRQANEFGDITFNQGIPYPMPQALRLDFPEIEAVTIVDCNSEPPVISVKNEKGEIAKYKESTGVAHVDPDYFEIFVYDWLLGSPKTALAEPNSVVISESLARKYFGQQNPLEKMLTYDNRLELQVTGVVKDVPTNTDLPFNILVAFDADQRVDKNWGNIYGSVHCYVKLAPGVDPKQIESRFGDFHAKYREKEKADKITLMLQPLATLHFDTRFITFNRTIAPETLWALGLICAALILIACINFINLNTALAIHRAKEVGLRKVLGGTKSKIIGQLLGETALVTLVAILAALVVADVAVNWLQAHIGYTLDFLVAGDLAVAIFLIVLFIVITVGAGLFPAFQLSRFTPLQTLRKPVLASSGGSIGWRKGLIILQFAISQALILGAITISSQTEFLRTTNMGFVRDAIVEALLPSTEASKLQRLKTELLQHAGIRSVSFSNTGTISRETWGGDYQLKDGDQVKEGGAQIKFVDADFLATYQVSLLAGEGFRQTDSSRRFLVNQAFARETGYSENEQALLDKQVSIWSREAPIAGIVEDFHTKSLHEEIEPVIFVAENIYRQVGIKIAFRDLDRELDTIERVWAGVFPDDVFDYAFLDDTIAKLYENEQRAAILISVFTIIAIAIGCLGLFGLISFMAARRTKEIGIRKVLGASVAGILALLSNELLKLVLLANLIAWPAAWYAMNKWLQSFAYRIEMSWWMFALAGGLALVIALLTVCTQAIRAALANPVDSLRYE